MYRHPAARSAKRRGARPGAACVRRKAAADAFRKFDKNLSGTIDIDEFYKMFHEQRSIFGDGIFELIGAPRWWWWW